MADIWMAYLDHSIDCDHRDAWYIWIQEIHICTYKLLRK